MACYVQRADHCLPLFFCMATQQVFPKTSLYTNAKFIGEGASGNVFRVTSQQNEKEWKQRAFSREVQSLRTLEGCSGIVSLHDTIVQDKVGMIVMKECGIDLYQYLQNTVVSHEEVRDIFFQICLAVQQCHQRGIAHLDLKLGNILMCENGIRICSQMGRKATLFPHNRNFKLSSTRGYSWEYVLCPSCRLLGFRCSAACNFRKLTTVWIGQTNSQTISGYTTKSCLIDRFTSTIFTRK